MLAPDRLSCFWPGLAQAWWRGHLAGLIAAVAFGWAVCLLMLATFVWPNWFWSWLVTLGWLATLIFWVLETVRSHWRFNRMQLDAGAGAGPGAGDDRFTSAQTEYLKGNWFDAESLLHAILTDSPRDAEAHLLLVSVLRHSGRLTAAWRRLEQLELLDTATRWTFEIAREKRLIERHRETIAE